MLEHELPLRPRYRRTDTGAVLWDARTGPGDNEAIGRSERRQFRALPCTSSLGHDRDAPFHNSNGGSARADVDVEPRADRAQHGIVGAHIERTCRVMSYLEQRLTLYKLNEPAMLLQTDFDLRCSIEGHMRAVIEQDGALLAEFRLEMLGPVRREPRRADPYHERSSQSQSE
jgi:hypothetical protein